MIIEQSAFFSDSKKTSPILSSGVVSNPEQLKLGHSVKLRPSLSDSGVPTIKVPEKGSVKSRTKEEKQERREKKLDTPRSPDHTAAPPNRKVSEIKDKDKDRSSSSHNVRKLSPVT